jgi:hypothetical protein
MEARIIFLKDTFDFKEIARGDSVGLKFKFFNKSKNRLVVKKIGVSCGCTNVSVDKDTIEANGYGVIKGIYISKEDSGKVLKTIVVETNTTPTLNVLFIKGHVYIKG